MTLIEALVLFLPAGIANAAPVLANKIPVLNRWSTPMDFGKSYRGRRIFGDHKTWRGFLFGTAVGALAGLVIHKLNPGLIESFRVAPFLPELEMTLIGAVLGFGALYGDAVKSFFKRQHNVPSGRSWFPFDQVDFIIGGLLAAGPLAVFSRAQMGVILAVYFGLHLLAAYAGFLLKLKDKPI